MHKLAKRIAEFFLWAQSSTEYGVDLYDYHDSYDSFEDFVTEIIGALYDAKRRKGLAADLKGMAENCEVEEHAREASALYREVMAI